MSAQRFVPKPLCSVTSGECFVQGRCVGSCVPARQKQAPATLMPPEGFALVEQSVADDAARYRWLRDTSPRTSSRGRIGVFVGMRSVYAGFSQPHAQVLDHIIDLAMDGTDLNEIHERIKSAGIGVQKVDVMPDARQEVSGG